MGLTLDQWIQTETSFITDIEEIIDVLNEEKQVYLYDTSAISSHELAYKNHNALLFFTYTKEAPILITDTVAHEMRLLEDSEYRYLTYLSQFSKILYVKEENLIDLLKIDFELTPARSKFLVASERAFSSIQWLKERVKEAKQSFTKSEQIILSSYVSFFSENDNVNRGEISLFWLSTVLEQLPGKTKVTFVGLDHDLYDFVERCYFSTTKASAFSNDITFLSNDTLIQSSYRNDLNQETLAKLVSVYRKPDRKTRYFRKVNKVLNLNQQKGKMSNEEFLQLLICDEIEIIY